MHNLAIHFQYPWLLLLIVPALALTLIPYFRLSKKYRRNRNRVISITLHMIVMTLCILVLAGLTISYQVDNKENELILLVDVSDTEEVSSERRDDFVKQLIDQSGDESLKVGVITFGFDQVYAAPLTYDLGGVYGDYLSAEQPDTSATDIAAALKFAEQQFTYPQTAKIVLVTDGKETDEEAQSVIRSIAVKGIKTDVVNISSEYENDNIQILGIKYPDRYLKPEVEYTVEVTVKCKEAASGTTIALYDNNELSSEQTFDLIAGEQTVQFNVTFASKELHELRAALDEDASHMSVNNGYRTFVYLEVFNKVLIIEQSEGESTKLQEVLTPDYEADILNLNGSDAIPATVDELRRYDQIILNNISNKDLTDVGLDKLVYSYVYDYGGGLLTVGGTDAEGNAHAYNRDDMKDTDFQQMLPVQAINYTPPIGVMLLIDTSGSMEAEYEGREKIEWAKQAAIDCLDDPDTLHERDFLGVMSMDDTYEIQVPLTSCVYKSDIKEKIMTLSAGASTIYSDSIMRAGIALNNLNQVDKRHIILITDGEPASSDMPDYIAETRHVHDDLGITLSVIMIANSVDSQAGENMEQLAQVGGGGVYSIVANKLPQQLRDDLKSDMIQETVYTPFAPTVSNTFSDIMNGVNYDKNANLLNVNLGGYFGTKSRDGAEVVLSGPFSVPLLAVWAFGEGRVGSFMCDLKGGDWSGQFMADENGIKIIKNFVDYVMPLSDIEPKDMTLTLEEDNYINRLTIFTALNEGEYIDGVISDVTGGTEIPLNELPAEQQGDMYMTSVLGSDNNYARCTFVLKKAGTYRITVNKHLADGSVITEEIFKSFSYSEEYDLWPFAEDYDSEAALASLARKGGGALIPEDEPWLVFETFNTAVDKVFDPRWAFIITSIVLFLLDIAVRKFKFKWIHEIIRERREKKAAQ